MSASKDKTTPPAPTEVQKTPTELEISHYRAETERMQAKYSFVKFLLTILIGGLFGTIVSYSIQWGRLQAEVLRQENEHLSQYVIYATDETPFIRLRLATYFMHVSRSTETRRRWGEYHAIVLDEYNEKRELLAQLEQERELTAQQQRQIIDLRAELTAPRRNTEWVRSVDYTVYIGYEGKGENSAKTAAEALRAAGFRVALYQRGASDSPLHAYHAAVSENTLRVFGNSCYASDYWTNRIYDAVEAAGVAVPQWIVTEDLGASGRPYCFFELILVE